MQKKLLKNLKDDSGDVNRILLVLQNFIRVWI